MWSSLPSNLRAVLGTALLLGIGVATAAFVLSFVALRAAAENPALQWGKYAWLFPIGIDAALIFFEVLLLGASMVRVEERGKVVPYPRAVPFLLVVGAGAATLYFNATRVPDVPGLRLVALAVPIASILVTLGLAYLLKMLAAASGADVVHLAPPALGPSRIVRGADVLDAELVRDPAELPRDLRAAHETPPREVVLGQTPRPERSEIGQAGQPNGRANGGRAVTDMTKREQVEAYLSRLDADNAARIAAAPAAGGREVAGHLAEHGITVDPRYATDVINRRWGSARRRRPSRR